MTAVATVAACATTADTQAAAPLAREPVTLDVDVSLVVDERERPGAFELTMCPRAPHAPWPRRLAPENRQALSTLVSARDGEGRDLEVGADGVRTLGVTGCVHLVLAIGALADEARNKDVALFVDDDLIATPDVWLWRPDPFPTDARLLVRVLDGPFQAVLPWTERTDDGARFVVDARTFRLKSDAAFGRFTVRTLEVPGAQLDVIALGDAPPPAQVVPWLESSARAVAALSGKFPVPRLTVLMCAQPAPRPVLVGFFARGGGPVALFFVATQATDIDDDDHERTGRWALTHELAHAWLPPVRTEDAWFNEGLATWHQDLLARRAGIIDSDVAYWRGVVRGLKTGRARADEDGLSLVDASARMHQTGAYQHAYWAGVALLLIAEVEARQQGASIDDVVLFLRRRFPVDDRQRSADELLREAEREGGPVSAAARAWRNAFDAHKDEAFPDVSAVLAELGIVDGALDGDTVDPILDDTAPLAHVRHALTAAVPTS